jgi:RimJ/RimL family protein N-acetyltransferase
MIELSPMTEPEFRAYLEGMLEDYAQEHVAVGNWSAEEAQQRAEAQVRQILPNGLATPDNYFFTIKDAAQGAPVGILWFAARCQGGKPGAFVYDIRIYDEFRQRGYGTQALRALEEKGRALGLASVSLHVFGHNHPARAMYAKLGYVETDVMMGKVL